MSPRRSSTFRSRLAVVACLVLASGLVGAFPAGAEAEEGRPSRRDRLVSLLSPELAAEFHFSEHLGWRFVEDAAVREITVHTGRPATRQNLADARTRGDLLVRIPPTASDALLLEFAPKLPLLADSVGSRCAYQLRLSDAMDRAMVRLTNALDRETWTFPKFLMIDSLLWRLSPPEPEWVSVEKTFRPNTSPRAAIEAVFTRETVTECYAGQLLTLFAVQYELYGPERYDHAFAPDDIVLGRPPKVENVPFGWNTYAPGYHNRRALFVEGKAQAADPALTLGALGHKAFTGMAGIIRDPTGRQRCNENFVVVRVSDRAMRDLVKDGGFVAIEKATARARELHILANNLLTTADDMVRLRGEVEAILAEPKFTEVEVFIHPYGVVPIRKIAWKKMRFQNAGIGMELYCCGRENAFFQRYRETFRKLWYWHNHPGVEVPGPHTPVFPEMPEGDEACPPAPRPPQDQRPPRPAPATLVGCP